MTKTASLVRVGIAYVIAIGVGAAWLWLGPDTAHLWLDGLVADTLATLVIFGSAEPTTTPASTTRGGACCRRCWRSTGGRPGRSSSATSGAGWSSA